jgi:hypothetical protein
MIKSISVEPDFALDRSSPAFSRQHRAAASKIASKQQ